ncbi:VIR protein [Plasmodium vivax]|uniref:VIR protein n=1 Tax=Plasmodium vivax TaxID=5855 RepID=A0A1G4HDP5_PLAVI|nr:VIR protein [Plasmodium vivax]
MDLERWKEKHSFLENVLGIFKEYNTDITDEKYGRYSPCIILNYPEDENRMKYVHFCRKLIRNIWLIYEQTEEDMEQSVILNRGMTKYEHCSYLNKWIYYYLKKVPVPENIIDQIFKITHNMLNANLESYKCKYESLNEDYLEPYNVIKLSLFADNIESIPRILNNALHHDYSACLKYIRECVNIYKKMNKEHCKSIKHEDKKYATTCDVLEIFKVKYESEIYNILPEKDEVLNLKNEKMDPGVELKLNVDEYSVEASEQFSGSLQRNLSTGAAAAAGTGALLLALNKFTSVGKLFRSRKRTPEVGNILEEGPPEAPFLNDPDYMHMNSDTMSYNVGYGTTENY